MSDELNYDDGFDEDEEDTDTEEEQETEKFLDNMDNNNTGSPYWQNNNRTSYGGGGYSTGQQPYVPPTQGGIWGNSAPQWNQPRFQGSTGYSPFSGNSQGGIPWGQTASQRPSPNYGAQQKELNRNKKIVFCDLLDNLIESIQAGGKLGVQPRGIFDIRLKFEVWDKIACLSPDYVFVLTNQNIVPDSIQAIVFRTMADYVMYSLAEYLRLPYENCQCLIKAGFEIGNEYSKPGTGLITKALETIPDVTKKYKKEDMLVIGAMSGGAGQSNKDALMAQKFGVDYIDIYQLLSQYS